MDPQNYLVAMEILQTALATAREAPEEFALNYWRNEGYPVLSTCASGLKPSDRAVIEDLMIDIQEPDDAEDLATLSFKLIAKLHQVRTNYLH